MSDIPVVEGTLVEEPKAVAARRPDNVAPLMSDAEMLQLMMGDLSSLTTQQKTLFIQNLCWKHRLDPSTKPFDLIVLNNKLTVYANKSASDQIRKRDGISSVRLYNGPLRFGFDANGQQKYNETVWEVEYELTNAEGRKEFSTGCVGINNLTGDALGNAVMKCDTKAKRRGTLAMGGLGFLDELEVESVQKAKEEVGEGRPRRVFPKPVEPPQLITGAEVAALMQPVPVVDKTRHPDPVEARDFHPQPAAEKPPAPPTFNGGRTILPAGKPPVKV